MGKTLLIANDTQVKVRPFIGKVSGTTPNQHEDCAFTHWLSKIYGLVNELLISWTEMDLFLHCSHFHFCPFVGKHVFNLTQVTSYTAPALSENKAP